MDNEQNPYYCDICNYSTHKKDHFNNHLASKKHIRLSNNNIDSDDETETSDNYYVCENCNKFYKHKSTLSKHKKICVPICPPVTANVVSANALTALNLTEQGLTDLIEVIVKNVVLATSKNQTNNITGDENICVMGDNNTTNNVKQHFNLNFFLNEQCKDALNISEFTDSIKISIQDLEYTANHGYVEGITKVIIDRLKDLGQFKRPIHCTDVKRDVLYVKHENK